VLFPPSVLIVALRTRSALRQSGSLFRWLRGPLTFPPLLSVRLGRIGWLRDVTLIFGWVQPQTRLSPTPQQQVDTGNQVLQLLVRSIPELLVGEQLLVLG
jgi:hypothetical protein